MHFTSENIKLSGIWKKQLCWIKKVIFLQAHISVNIWVLNDLAELLHQIPFTAAPLRMGTSHHIQVPARPSWPYPGQILPSTRAGTDNQVQCSIKQRASRTHRKGKEKRKYSRDIVISMHFTNQMSVKIRFTWLERVILHGGNWHIKLQSTGEMERRSKSLYLKD